MPQSLDPTTNLPTGRQNNEKQLTVEDLLKNREATVSAARTTPVHGTFGKYSPDANISPDVNFNQLRAMDQSGWEILGKSLLNAVGGVIIGEGIASIGYMADAPKYIANLLSDAPGDITDGTEREGRRGQSFERNALSQAGHVISDYFFNNFEVYQTEQAQSGSFNPFRSGSRLRDATFWGANAPSVLSSLTLMIPSFAAARSMRILAAAMGLQKTARSAKAMEIIGSSVFARHNYNMMEGYDLMDRQTEHYLERGHLHTEAKQLASLDAGRFYSTGYLNLWKDMIQWTALLRGAKYAQASVQRSAIDALKRNPSNAGNIIRRSLERGRSLTQAAKDSKLFTPSNMLLQAGLEGVEEFNIQFQKNWSARNADYLLGLQEGDAKSFFESYFSGDFFEELRNPETQNAALMAFLGGPFIQGAFSGINYASNRRVAVQQSQEALNHANSIKLMQDKLKEIEQFSAQGNDVAAQKAMDDLIAGMALTGLVTESGTFRAANDIESLEVRKQMFKAVAEQLSNEDLSDLGLGPEAKENAARALKELDKIGELYKKNAEEVTSDIPNVIVAFLTEEQYLNEKAKERKQKAIENIDSVFQKSGIKELISKEGVSTQRIKREAELHALKQFEKQREGLRDVIVNKQRNALRHKLVKRRYDETTDYIKQRINELETSHSEDPTSPAERTAISRIVNEAEWNENFKQMVLEDIFIRESEANIAEYITDDFANEYKQVVQLQNEELENIINKYFFERAIQEESLILHEDKPYSVVHEEAGTMLHELSTETGQPTGEKIPMTAEIWNQSVVDSPLMKMEQFVTEEKRTELLEEMNKDLENEEFGKFLAKLQRLHLSGLKKSTSQASRRLLTSFKNWVDKQESPMNIINAANVLSEGVPSEEVKKQIKQIADTHKKLLTERYDKEIERIEAASAPTISAVQSTRKKIEKIDAQIEELSKGLKEFSSEQIQEKINVEKEKIEAQRAKELEGVESDVDRTVINKKYDDRITAETIKIIEHGSEQNRLVKQRVEDTKETKKSLLDIKKKLENTLENYEYAVSIYNKIREAFENNYGYDPALTTIGITEELLEGIGTDAEIAYIESLFESQSLKQLDVEKGIRSLEADIEAGLTAVDKLVNNLEAVVGVNTIFQTAMKNAYHRLLSENTNYSNISNFTTSLINRFKNILLNEIAKTRPSQKLTREQLKALNIARIELQKADITELAYRDVVPERAFDFLMSEAREEFVERTKKRFETGARSLALAYRDIRILTHFQSAVKRKMSEKKNNVRKNRPKKERDDSPAKKRLEHAWVTQSGNTLGTDKTAPSSSDVRYSEGVININPYSADTPVTLMVVKPEDVGIEVSEEVKAEFGDEPIFYGIAVKELDNDTIEYYKKDGSTTKEFSLDESLYTSMPKVNTTIEYLDKNQKPELEEKYKEAHKKLVDDWLNGENTLLDVTSKSQGIVPSNALVENAYDYDKGKPNPAKEILGDNLNIFVMHDNELTVQGFTYRGKKGSYVHFDESTGNFHEIVSRRLNKEEIQIVTKWLEGYAEKVKFNSRGKPKIKENELDVEGITAKQLLEIRDQFSYENQIKFELLKNKITVYGEEFPILARDASGKLMNRLYNIEAIESMLETSLTNISSAKYKSNPKITPIVFKGGKFETLSPISYKDHVHNNLAHTWRKKSQEKITVKEGVSVDAPILFNQQFRYEHPYIGEGIEIESSKKAQKINTPEYNVESAKDFKDIPDMPDDVVERFKKADESIPFYDESQIPTEAQPREVLLGEPIIQEDGTIVGQAEDVVETTGEIDILTPKPERPSRKKTKDTEVTKEPTVISGYEVVEGQELSEEGKRALEMMANIDTSKKPKRRPKKKGRSDTGAADFQRSSSFRLLNRKEKANVVSNLRKRTGINFNMLTTDQAVYLLEHLRDQGIIDETFTAENVPRGMNYSGIAYTFGDVTLDTPFHEISHPIVYQIISDNADLFGNLKREVRRNSPELIDRVLKNYPRARDAEGNISTNAWAEIITTSIGELAAKKYDARHKGLINAIRRLFEEIKQFFRNVSGSAIHIERLSPLTTVEQLASILGETSQKFSLTKDLSTIDFHRSNNLNKPNTNPVLLDNQQEQVKKFSELQERLNNKEFIDGAKGAYESTPTLQQYGTQSEYNDYIARVSLGITKNPTSGGYNYNSQVKDIVYHGRKTKENIKNKDRNKHGFYFGTKDQAERISEMAEGSSIIYIQQAIINLKNPKTTTFQDREVSKYEKTNDGFIIEVSDKDALDLMGSYPEQYSLENFKKEYVVFQPEQIHILGSKQDIQGFKEFNKNKDAFEKIKTKSGQTLSELGISKENWYILPDSTKEHILYCN